MQENSQQCFGLNLRGQLVTFLSRRSHAEAVQNSCDGRYFPVKAGTSTLHGAKRRLAAVLPGASGGMLAPDARQTVWKVTNSSTGTRSVTSPFSGAFQSG